MNYALFKITKSRLHADYVAACDALRAIPGVGTGPMGLTPDAVKFSPTYRLARQHQQAALTALQTFNRRYVKHFSKDIQADIAAKRAAKPDTPPS